MPVILSGETFHKRHGRRSGVLYVHVPIQVFLDTRSKQILKWVDIQFLS